ncbi:MAG: WcbI family polysaccharide biosynthesis putative acetyltransferase [Methylocystis sp.]
MKIGVVGNCTALAIGLSLMQLLEDSTVYALSANDWKRKGKLDEAVDLLKSCDIVFLHILTDAFGELEWARFQKAHSRAYALPSIVFTGFHPDCIYINAKSGSFVGSPISPYSSVIGSFVGSPIGPYSSAIAAAVYSLGGDAETAVRLFNPDAFERLGYFAEFEKAKGYLFKTFAQCGLDAASEWEGWMREAPFMHTINHPRPIIAASVAKQLAKKAGLIRSNAPSPVAVLDTLAASVIWPVYPEIGAALGIHGDYLFKKMSAPLDLSDGVGPFIRLKPFVEQSFDLFEKFNKSCFDEPSVKRTADVVREMM